MGEKVKPLVATILIAFNKPADVERVLTSLKKSETHNFRHQVILLDNSTDQTARGEIAKIAKRYVKLVLYKPQKHNLGFASGMNRGFGLARKLAADYYFMLNIDTEVTPKTIDTLIKSQQQHNAALIAPLMTYGDDHDLIWYAGGQANHWLGVVRHPHRNQKVTPADKVARRVSFINGTAILLPASTIAKYGELFADYFMYYEETDWCARIIRAGGELWYEPKALIYHYTAHSDFKTDLALYYLTRNHWLYLKRGVPKLYYITAIPSVIGYQIYRWLRYLFNGQNRHAIWQGWLDMLRHRYGERQT